MRIYCESLGGILPTLQFIHLGGHSFTPPGQVTGLAVASALVTLGNPRRPSIDVQPAKEPKSKRKQSQHPDSCI